jgi:DNA replication regulator DPB11
MEWLDDSIERGMVLEESLYDPTLALEERGRNAWNRQALEIITQGKRQREEKPTEVVSQNKRKIRRTVSVRLGSQQGNMWAEMTSASSAQGKHDEWQPTEFNSVLGAIPTNIDSGSEAVTPDPTTKPPKTMISQAEPTDGSQARGVFHGNLVYVHGFTGPKLEILRTHLDSHGARICTSPADLLEEDNLENGYLLIPHDVPEDQLPLVPDSAQRLQQVTEWWVESCLASKTLVNPGKEPLCRPFKTLNIEGRHTHKISRRRKIDHC